MYREKCFTKNKIHILCSFSEFAIFEDFFDFLRKWKKSSFKKENAEEYIEIYET